MGYYDGNWRAGQWLAMGSLIVLFSGLLIGLVVWAVRRYRSSGQRRQTRGGSTAGPDTVVAERYARGVIDEDEFLRRRDLLHSAAGSRSDGKRTP